MKTNNKHDWMESRLKELDAERDALMTLVSIYKEKTAAPVVSKAKVKVKRIRTRGRKRGVSITRSVTDAAVELIKKTGKSVKIQDIYNELENKKISLGKSKNKKAFLAVIIAQELKKKDSLLKKVKRGVYNIK